MTSSEARLEKGSENCTMQAAYVETPGGAGSIHVGELAVPTLVPGSVRVRVEAVAVDHVDTYIRSGAYPLELPRPFIIGRDMVGTVEALGEGVRGFRVGDAVWSNCLGIDGQQGTFADYVTAPAERLYPLPAGVAPQIAVATLHSALTAAIGLETQANLQAGETLFIHGGSGSVGLAVLQVAKAMGARVGVTAGSEAKARLCRERGADVVVNYHDEDVPRAIRDFAPEGLDVYWEATPQLDLEALMPLMAFGARLVVIAGGSEPAALPARAFYLKNATLAGFTVTGAGVEALGGYARRINDWLARGVITPPVHAVLPLSQAAYAHRLQEAGGLTGKLVLFPGR